MRALIIDDSRAMRSILSGILGDIGCTVEQAADAESAADLLERDRDFDFALVDWNLPGMNGLELVKIIRQDADLSRVRLMMVTTETETTQVVRGENHGKTLTSHNIVRKVRHVGEWDGMTASFKVSMFIR